MTPILLTGSVPMPKGVRVLGSCSIGHRERGWSWRGQVKVAVGQTFLSVIG